MVTTTNLSAYYKLDETSGTNVEDSHNTNDGTNTNATVNQTGKINTAYDFNGSTSYISIPTSTDLLDDLQSGFSISVWINPDTYGEGGYGRIVNINDGSSGYNLLMNTGSDRIELNIDGTQYYSAADSMDPYVGTGTWAHVVATVSAAGEVKLYIQGSQSGSTGSGGDPSTITSTSSTYIGDRSTGGRAFNGKIDEIGIWGRVLSDTEVSELYNSGSGLAYPFSVSEIAQSSSIDINNGIITTAKLTATFSSGSADSIQMTADGTNWETVTSGTAHIFTNTGQDLKWKITATTATLTEVKVEDYHL